MLFVSGNGQLRRAGIISTTTIAAIGNENSKKNKLEILFLFYSGLAYLFWKVYNRRTSRRLNNQGQNRPPLVKTPSVDGLQFNFISNRIVSFL